MTALHLPFPSLKYPFTLTHAEHFLLVGSCFSEHIAKQLEERKFRVCSNPSGVLFNPASICENMQFYARSAIVCESDLFFFDELYHSFSHHGQFSHTRASTTAAAINQAHHQAHLFLQNRPLTILITLGSAWVYRMRDNGRIVANCHQCPAQTFRKDLLTVDTMVGDLSEVIELFPDARFILTVSPVRHSRESLVDNSRSKGRLLDTAQTLCERFTDRVFYFPAYEIVVDVLRDYRFYDIDGVHPNFLATQVVFEQFAQAVFTQDQRALCADIMRIRRAVAHRPRHPQTQKHHSFLRTQLDQVQRLAAAHPHICFREQICTLQAQIDLLFPQQRL